MEFIATTNLNSITLQNYSSFSQCKFKDYFFAKVDSMIKDKIPIDYEYSLSNNQSEIANKYIPKKSDFVDLVIFPRIAKVLKDHRTYLEIEAIQLTYQRKFKFFMQEDKTSPYEEDGKIKLNETEFLKMRNKVLVLLISEYYEECNREGENFSYPEKKRAVVAGAAAAHNQISSLSTTVTVGIIENTSNLSEGQASGGTMSNSTNNKPRTRNLNLSNFLTYYNDDHEYYFNIDIKFELFLKLIHNEEAKEEFAFWFLFFIPNLGVKITNYEYEYFFTEINENNIVDVHYRIGLILSDYLTVNQAFLSLQKEEPIENISLTFHDNSIWAEEIWASLEMSHNTGLIEYIKSCHIPVVGPGSIKSSLSQSLKFNNLILNSHGTYFTNQAGDILKDKLKFNTVNSFMVNLFEFDHLEYIYLTKKDEKLVEEIEDHYLSLFTQVKDIISSLEKKSLTLLILQVKGFTSHKSYLNSIMKGFDDMVAYICDIMANHKTINVMINVTDNVGGMNNNTSQILFSSLHSKPQSKLRNLEKEDLTLSDPSLVLEQSMCMYKMKKTKSFLRKISQLTLFEKELKILKKSNANRVVVDFYFFRAYNLHAITHLKLGYFHNFKELVKFLSKMDLSSFTLLSKVVFYINSNKGFLYDYLDHFFGLAWPKRTLKTMKFYFEKLTSYDDFDIFSVYHNIISQKYFKKDEAINGAYPLNFISFCRIDNHLLYKVNMNTLSHIVYDLPLSRKFDKKLQKQKLRDKFFNSIVMSEYMDTQMSHIVLRVFYKIDQKYPKLHLVKSLMGKIHSPKFKDQNIFQCIFKFLKCRRVVYNDFHSSHVIFEYYSDHISKSVI